MTRLDVKAIWMGIMVAMLALTSPGWLGPNARPPVGYDAPWIYPALNPAVRAEMPTGPRTSSSFDTIVSFRDR